MDNKIWSCSSLIVVGFVRSSDVLIGSSILLWLGYMIAQTLLGISFWFSPSLRQTLSYVARHQIEEARVFGVDLSWTIQTGQWIAGFCFGSSFVVRSWNWNLGASLVNEARHQLGNVKDLIEVWLFDSRSRHGFACHLVCSVLDEASYLVQVWLAAQH